MSVNRALYTLGKAISCKLRHRHHSPGCASSQATSCFSLSLSTRQETLELLNLIAEILHLLKGPRYRELTFGYITV